MEVKTVERKKSSCDIWDDGGKRKRSVPSHLFAMTSVSCEICFRFFRVFPGFSVSGNPETRKHKTNHTPFLCTTTIPMSGPLPQHIFFLSSVFEAFISHVEDWEHSGVGPSGLIPSLLSFMAKPDPRLGNVSTLQMLGLSLTPPPSPPPPALPPPP